MNRFVIEIDLADVADNPTVRYVCETQSGVFHHSELTSRKHEAWKFPSVLAALDFVHYNLSGESLDQAIGLRIVPEIA